MANTFKTRWWQIGTLLPVLMATLFVCDIAGRFVPLELVAFRTWEPSLRTTHGAQVGFEPRKITVVHRAYGDLASIANARALRQYHEEELRSDEMGFRNSYDIFNAHYAGIVTGDSFTVGGGVAEADTLSGKLTDLAGARFYNAGWRRHLGPGGVANLAGGLKIRSGVLVCEVLERHLRLSPPPTQDLPPGLFTSPKAAERTMGATSFLPWLTGVQRKFFPAAPSPLQIFSQRIVKRFQNGKLLPNPYWNRVAHETLTNGDDMLFFPRDLDPIGDVDTLSASWAKYFEWYDNKLKEQNLKLLVLLIPNKYTVYGPLATYNPPPANGDRLLKSVAQQLRAKGIPVVNLTEEFRAVAAKRLPEHQYLYWRDDTHWNAAGIAVAADEVWSAIQTLQQPSGASAAALQVIPQKASSSK